jgi:type IV pilus assembly protein PilA
MVQQDQYMDMPEEGQSTSNRPTKKWFIPSPTMIAGTGMMLLLVGISAPSFLNQANKAKESEAKQYVGAIIRSQQAYFLEHSRFATNIGKVGSAETNEYVYLIYPKIGSVAVQQVAIPKNPKLHSYAGIVRTTERGREVSSAGNICKSIRPGQDVPTLEAENFYNLSSDDSVCPVGFQPLER